MNKLLGFSRGARHALLGALASASLLAAPAAHAEDKAKKDSDDVGLGLAPGSPQVGSLPGGIQPSYGQRSEDEQDYRFDYHGILVMPLRAGFNKRTGDVTPDQHTSVIHAPPVVPDYQDSFNYTTVVPQPYAQLMFSYGNNIVTGTASIVARTASTATSFFQPPLQSGITDAFVTFNLPNLAKNMHVEANVGAFSNAYGQMGEYDLGHYGTPIIARINGVGETIGGRFALGDLTLAVEQGIQMQFDKAPVGIASEGWNSFARPEVGTGLAHHEHLGIGYRRQATLGLHFIQAWTQDDRAAQVSTADGTITTLGADFRFSASHLGHLYVGGAYTKADHAESVGRIIEINNAQGGFGLMQNYLGQDNKKGVSGSLMTIGGQYDLSLAHLLLYPRTFDGKSNDLVLSLFGMYTRTQSEDDTYDKVNMTKFGAEAGYSLASWFAFGGRLDHVSPNSKHGQRDFDIVSPRLIFRSDWQSRDQVVLQYSHFFYRKHPLVRDGYPPVDAPNINPDADMVSISANMWW
ncbi:MAG TPA: hypothetical protein VHB79_11860 [Polyangiaceae bacterium]|nr:hypothetical protein [Polyangiaceae bacterium]